MRIVKDDSVTTVYGYYRCPECGRTYYAGGIFYHSDNCSKHGYLECEYHVGPRCKEYSDAEDE
jgi:DNA-directed RNA polymerase subunit RPC12/RpoP